jgi:VanZ family protein
MAVIFFLSSRQAISTSEVYLEDFLIKKTAHFVIYFVLGVATFRALKNTSGLPVPRLLFWTIIICGLYAVSDEIHQSFVPGRGPSVRDVIIDLVGTSSALVVMNKLRP